MTIPYISLVDLQEEDFQAALTVPRALASVIGLFREATNSTRPQYRLLCLHRASEGVQKVQHKNTEELKARGITPQRTRRSVTDNQHTRKKFPDLIGRRAGAFLDHVTNSYRNHIAHFNFDDYERAVLESGNVNVDHDIGATNAVLAPLVRQMIEDEWTLMDTYGLGAQGDDP